MSEPRVTITDVRRAGFCPHGIRMHCRVLGIDMRRLIDSGIPISEVEGIKDKHVQRAIEVARKRIDDGR